MDFPILVKLIDAKEPLSIQVHPDDEYALEKENEYGKNEMWYVLDAEPGAYIYCGFDKKVSREEVERRIQNHTVTESINFTKIGKSIKVRHFHPKFSRPILSKYSLKSIALCRPGMVPLLVIEVSSGENVTEDDMIPAECKDLTETDLGYQVEPYVKLQPAYKDYLHNCPKPYIQSGCFPQMPSFGDFPERYSLMLPIRLLQFMPIAINTVVNIGQWYQERRG